MFSTFWFLMQLKLFFILSLRSLTVSGNNLFGSFSVTATGAPQYTSTLEVSIDLDADLVTLSMTGPSDWYFAFGFDSFEMADTYAIIIDEIGNIFEHILGNHNKGTEVTTTDSIQMISSQIFTNEDDGLSYRTVVAQRPIDGSDTSVGVPTFSFPREATSIAMIWSQGGGRDGLGVSWRLGGSCYHGGSYRNFGSILNIEQVSDEFVFECPDETDICDDSPCGCGEVEHCAVCNQGQGCVYCEDGYFRRDMGTQCLNCQETFGDSCLQCVSLQGCVRCEEGTTRIHDTDCNLWVCQ